MAGPLAQLRPRLIRRLAGSLAAVRLLHKCGGLGAVNRLCLLTVDDEDCEPGKDTVLCLDRLHFSRDIAQLRQRAPAYNWLKLPEDTLGRFQRAWVPQKQQRQTKYYALKAEGDGDAYAESEAMAVALIEQISKRYPIRAVMSAHLDYWQSEGMRRACARLSIPFLTLLREVQTIPATYNMLLDEYVPIDFKYGGAGIAVFNARTRAALLDSKACEDSLIDITGAPRLDPWLDLFRTTLPPLAERRQITLMSYFHPLYFAQENFLQASEILGRVAAAHPDLSFIVKSKGKADSETLRGAYAGRGVDTSRLEFSHEPNLVKICTASRVVVGFNSLTIVEALFSDTIVIIPQWADAVGDKAYQNVDPDDPLAQKIYYFPRSAAEFEDMILRAARNELPPRPATRAEKIAYLNYFFRLDPDETASQRVAAFVRRYVRA